MGEKSKMHRKICELSFAIDELELFLDTHPDNIKAIGLLTEFRKRYNDAVTAYESQYGPYIVTSDDVNPTDRWSWIDSPWPWDNDFMED